MAPAIQVGTAGSVRTLVPPRRLAPGHPGSSGQQDDLGRKGTHLAPPGSAEEDLEGREGRALCVDGPPGRGAAARPWVTGSRAHWLLSLLLRLPRRFLPCPTGSPCLLRSSPLAGPGEVMFPAERAQGDARAKSKQRGGERGREGEKERESHTESGSTNGISGCPASGDNKQAWSLFARAGGRGKGQRVWKGAPGMSSQAEAVAAPFPVPSGNVPLAEVIPTHPYLEISHLNAAPKL